MNIRNLLWLVPFILSLLSYSALTLFIPRTTIISPSILGKSLPEALSQLSTCGLNARIVSYKEDPDLPEGTVLSQSPSGNKRIKPGQTVRIAVSVHPPAHPAPSLRGLTEPEIQRQLHADGLRAKFFNVISPYPQGTCVAHIPEAGQPIHEKTVLCYMSHTDANMVIFPDVTGQHVAEVQHALAQQGITPTVSHSKTVGTHHTCRRCIVRSQKPLAGSIIARDKLTHVQLQV